MSYRHFAGDADSASAGLAARLQPELAAIRARLVHHLEDGTPGLLVDGPVHSVQDAGGGDVHGARQCAAG